MQRPIGKVTTIDMQMRTRRHGLRSFAVALLTLCALRVARADADTTRVLLIDPGSELERAVRAALEPWQLAISVISAPSPGSSAPLSHQRASALAAREQAATVVWISTHEAGYALWIYDVTSQHVHARPLSSAPPYEGPQAAAAALTLKTLLRHSESAPREQRFGAEPREAAQPEPTRPKAALPAARPPSTSQVTPRGPSRIEPDAAPAARFAFIDNRSIEPRIGLGVTVWPRGGMFGFALRTAFGPDHRLKEARFQGALSSITAGAALRLRWEPRRWLRVAAGLAALCDFTRLHSVTLLTGERAPDTWRYAPAGAAELELAWLALPWLRIGLRGSPAWIPRPQRYLAGETKLLELSRVSFEAALVFGFGDHDS